MTNSGYFVGAFAFLFIFSFQVAVD